MNALCGLLGQAGSQSRREFHVIFLNVDHVLGRNSVHNIFLGFRKVVLEIFNVNATVT